MSASSKTTAALVSIGSNTCLTAAKLIAALLSGSVSVLSEAVHSFGDIIASVLAWLSVRVSDKPADTEHPFGHGKAESLAGLAEALLLFGAACYVGYEAIRRFIEPEPIRVDVALGVILGAAVINVFVSRYLRRVAEETDSDALRADAAHITADVVTSAGVTLALILVAITSNPIFDPLVALALTIWILYTSFKIARNSFELLMDRSLPEDELELVLQVLKEDPRVLDWHQLRTRKSGSHRHIDGHILLEDGLSLIQAHEIAESVEDRIREALPNVSISLHMEPFSREIKHRRSEHQEE